MVHRTARRPRRGEGPSPLDTVDAAFRALTSGPRPLALHGGRIGHGLPRRPIRLDELTVMLLHPSVGYAAREAVWAELVRRARSGDPAWVVGAVGVALPGLRRVAGRLARGYTRPTEDLDAEVLAGFLQALRGIDIDAGRIPARLCWAAYRRGRALRFADEAFGSRRGDVVNSCAPPRPWGHPDFVLAKAVAAKVITAAEAELIGRTRLEGVSLAQVAAELGISKAAVKMRRHRAEQRLVQAIVDGTLDGPAGSARDTSAGRAVLPRAA